MKDRFAVIDVGTNTVKLLVADCAAGIPTPVLETAEPARLGEGLAAGRLSEFAMERTLAVLSRFRELIRDLRVEKVRAVGTYALRNASNSHHFLGRVRSLGIQIRVISGDEESYYSHFAVRYDPLWRTARNLLVVDIGGGSTEIIFDDFHTSLPIGAVRLTESKLMSDPPTESEVAEAIEMADSILQALPPVTGGATVVGVGGTWTTLASVKLIADELEPESVHGTSLSLRDIDSQIELYRSRTIEQRQQVPGLPPSRADIILGGAIILRRLLTLLGADRAAVSARGLRWGVLYEMCGRTE